MSLNTALLNSCWNTILLLAEKVREYDQSIKFCSFLFGNKESVSLNNIVETNPGSFSVIISLKPEAVIPESRSSQIDAGYKILGISQMKEVWSDRIPEDIKQMICSYVPYCFLSIHSKMRRRAISVSHFAQSLDGLIADSLGNSKWIGNHENLIHAHRMRALCDGIIIGSRTFKSDNPRLNVRYVKGPNPTRIILGFIGNNIETTLAVNTDSILVFGGESKSKNTSVRFLPLKRKNKYINSLDILKTLYSERIYSVYIEGGAITTSEFMSAGMIDICQLHISPMILGRGVKAMSNLKINKINDSIRFTRFSYIRTGKELMFVGEPKGEGKDG